MANIKYRASSSPTLPGSTTVKGTPLTNLEGDANLKSINNQLELLTTNTSITDDVATAVEVFPMWALAPVPTSGVGAVPYRISTTKLRYIPSTDTLIAANFQGNASTVTTNANLTGEVTSVGNATTVQNSSVISKVLTGYTSTPGTINATDSILSAIEKLNGNFTSNTTDAAINGKLLTGYAAVGTAALPTAASSILSAIIQLAYNDTLTGEVTRTAGSTAATVANSAVIGKLLTGYTISGTAANLSASSTILGAFQQLAFNDTLTGEVTRTAGSTAATVANSAVIGKLVTGYTSALASTAVADTDTVLQALAKMAPKLSPVLTTPTLLAAPAVDNSSLLLASTGWYMGQTSAVIPAVSANTGVIGSSLKWAKADHVHPDLRPTFRAHLLTTAFTFTSGAGAVVTIFNTKTGTGGFENVASSYSTATGRWTPGTIGYYNLRASIRLTGTTITDATISFVLNGAGAATVLSSNRITGVSVTELTMSLDDIVSLNGTDTIEVRLTVTGTGTLNGAIGTDKTFFSGAMISR
jgi:hypothetical protein